MLFYNALTAITAENQTYAATLGFTVTDGRIDLSSVLLSSVEGPFVADGTTQLPFVPAAVYRNDTVATDAALNAYDVYYYSASARTVWIYSRKAAGPHHGGLAQRQRPHQCDSGRHQLHAGFLGSGIGPLVPQRRRSGAGGHPAVGHEQRGGGRSDWRGSPTACSMAWCRLPPAA